MTLRADIGGLAAQIWRRDGFIVLRDARVGQGQQLTVAKSHRYVAEPALVGHPALVALAASRAIHCCVLVLSASAVKGWFSSRHDHQGPQGIRACNCTMRIPWKGSRRSRVTTVARESRGPSLSTDWISRPPIEMRCWRYWRKAVIQDPLLGSSRSRWLEALHWVGLVLGTVRQLSRLSAEVLRWKRRRARCRTRSRTVRSKALER